MGHVDKLCYPFGYKCEMVASWKRGDCVWAFPIASGSCNEEIIRRVKQEY